MVLGKFQEFKYIQIDCECSPAFRPDPVHLACMGRFAFDRTTQPAVNLPCLAL